MKRILQGGVVLAIIFGVGLFLNAKSDEIDVVENQAKNKLVIGKPKEIKDENQDSGILSSPEYSSFENYITRFTKDFNKKPKHYSEDDYRSHMIMVALTYYNHYDTLGEVPKEAQELIEKGIKVGKEFKNGGELEKNLTK